MAKILTLDDLFSHYDFEDEAKIQIHQLYNADKSIISVINALCLKAKLSKDNDECFTHLHTNCYLLKTPALRLVFKKEGRKVLFVSIAAIKL